MCRPRRSISGGQSSGSAGGATRRELEEAAAAEVADAVGSFFTPTQERNEVHDWERGVSEEVGSEMTRNRPTLHGFPSGPNTIPGGNGGEG